MSEPQTEPAAVEAVAVSPEIGIFPLRSTLVYPYMPHQLTAGRERSIRVLEAAVAGDNLIGLFAQRSVEAEEPGVGDLYPIGTVAKIHRLWRIPDGSVRLIVQGMKRCSLIELVQENPFLRARIRELDDEGDPSSMAIQGLSRTVSNQFQAIVQMTPHLPDELQVTAMNIDHGGRLADFVASTLDLHLEEKQRVLELLDVGRRLEYLAELLAREQEILEVGIKIQSQVQEKLGKSQREFYLREQLKHIQRELSGNDPHLAEVESLRAKVEAVGLPAEAKAEAERELGRLEQMTSGSPEYSVARTYLDWVLALPWGVAIEEFAGLEAAARILDEDHYDLAKVKDRILEYLAVRQLRQEMKGPIVCFVGPPGVGKTSLGRSIARAMGRKFVRISLGGVHDEAEVRGHRRTYIGALPGRIIQGLRKAGSNCPVFMLDEIDKLGADFRGDPSAALLEVLDPEQNNTFVDHYLDVPFDLSKVLFITTANQLTTVPPALRDRMEEIALPGYTPHEKNEIARRHLLPRQVAEHGLKGGHLVVDDEVLNRLITEYTREAGLRQFERQLGTICRKVARRFVEGRRRKVRVRGRDLEEYLGPVVYFPEVAGRKAEIGVVTGLAATAAGGEILFIEATAMKGKRNLMLTGQLGEVMQESAHTALSYVRSRAQDWGIDPEGIAESDIHLHVPAGATPKEGPSAGVGLAVALVSLFSRQPVRSDVAMTGEITLRGRVLPVGGIRDKVLAAQRAGIQTVVLPKQNEKDLEEVPAPVREQMRFELVERFDEVLPKVLAGKVPTGHTARPAGERPAAKRPARRKAAAGRPAKKQTAAKRPARRKAAAVRPAGKPPARKKLRVRSR